MESGAIWPTRTGDLPALKVLIELTGLFPSDMLDDVIADYFNGNARDELWFTFDRGEPLGIAYCAPERMTRGTWNLLLVAVHPGWQGRGIGASLMRHIEQILARRGERVLLVETSGLPDFERTRTFYRKLGYDEEARIREFYQAGEDKIIFRKLLRTGAQPPWPANRDLPASVRE